jgi:Flp pilus assembly protein TadG
MPLVCLLLLGVVQVAVVVRDQLVVQHAAREAARAASVSASAQAAAASVVGAIDPNVTVSVASSAGRVTATVTFTSHTDVPLIGAFMPDLDMTASATMVREPPTGGVDGGG